MRQAGWRMLRTGSVDEPVASGVESALVARSLARACGDVAFIGPVLAHDLIRRADGSDEVDRGVAMARTLDTVARGSGAAVAVDSAAGARAVALGPDGRVVEVGFPAGDSPEGVDLTRRVVAADIDEGTPVGPITAEGLLAWEALGVALTAADLVGTMEGALRLTTDYAKQRRQFDSPIGSFQAVQHLLAEAGTHIEGAYSAMLHAAWAVDALPAPAARQAAAVAKAYASRSARTVCETAIQIHGGIGNTWECMAHVFLRRSLLSTELFGGAGAQLTLLARQRWGAA